MLFWFSSLYSYRIIQQISYQLNVASSFMDSNNKTFSAGNQNYKTLLVSFSYAPFDFLQLIETCKKTPIYNEFPTPLLKFHWRKGLLRGYK